MAFIDNPVIAALGMHLGLSPLFNAAGGDAPPNPEAASESAPNIPPAKSQPNVPEYKNRPYIPRNESQGTNSGGGVKPGVSNPVTPGMMDQTTLQSPQVQALLGQYGVHPSATPPDPNLFVHNPAAFEQHPVLSGLLERGLGGLAYSHEGNNFLQSLVGGVKGMQEYNADRASQANAQLMAPFSQANAIQDLQDKAQKTSDDHLKAQSELEYQKGLIHHYVAQDLTKSERIAAAPPRFDPKTGQPSYLKETTPDHFEYVPDENWTPNEHDAFVRQFYLNKKAELIHQYGSEDKIPADEIMKVLTGADTAAALSKGAAGIKVGAGHDTARVESAGISASTRNGGGKPISPGDKLLDAQLKQQQAAIQEELRQANGAAGYIIDPKDGSKKLALSAAGKLLIKAKRDKLDDIAKGRAAIAAKYTTPGGQAPIQPLPKSAGNPF